MKLSEIITKTQKKELKALVHDFCKDKYCRTCGMRIRRNVYGCDIFTGDITLEQYQQCIRVLTDNGYDISFVPKVTVTEDEQLNCFKGD